MNSNLPCADSAYEGPTDTARVEKLSAGAEIDSSKGRAAAAARDIQAPITLHPAFSQPEGQHEDSCLAEQQNAEPVSIPQASAELPQSQQRSFKLRSQLRSAIEEAFTIPNKCGMRAPHASNVRAPSKVAALESLLCEQQRALALPSQLSDSGAWEAADHDEDEPWRRAVMRHMSELGTFHQ